MRKGDHRDCHAQEPPRAVNPRIITMNEEEQVELLCRVDIFKTLSREEIRQILRDLIQRNAEISLEEGEVFYTPKEPDGKLFILMKGRVRLFKMEEEATHEFILEMVGAGSVFGEASFIAHRLRESYAEAMEPSVLLAMERTDVERLCPWLRSPSFALCPVVPLRPACPGGLPPSITDPRGPRSPPSKRSVLPAWPPGRVSRTE